MIFDLRTIKKPYGNQEEGAKLVADVTRATAIIPKQHIFQMVNSDGFMRIMFYAPTSKQKRCMENRMSICKQVESITLKAGHKN